MPYQGPSYAKVQALLSSSYTSEVSSRSPTQASVSTMDDMHGDVDSNVINWLESTDISPFAQKPLQPRGKPKRHYSQHYLENSLSKKMLQASIQEPAGLGLGLRERSSSE